LARKYRNGRPGPVVGRNGDRLSAGALGVAPSSEAVTESEKVTKRCDENYETLLMVAVLYGRAVRIADLTRSNQSLLRSFGGTFVLRDRKSQKNWTTRRGISRYERLCRRDGRG